MDQIDGRGRKCKRGRIAPALNMAIQSAFQVTPVNQGDGKNRFRIVTRNKTDDPAHFIGQKTSRVGRKTRRVPIFRGSVVAVFSGKRRTDPVG